MVSRTRVFPGHRSPPTFAGPARAAWRAPWEGKPVTAPKGFPESRIEWRPLRALVPRKGSAATAQRPMARPGATYPALLVTADLSLLDGHHRYYKLRAAGYCGLVPVVRAVRWGTAP